MNILIITATYPPSTNGVAISTKRTVKELRQKGHNIYIAAPKYKKRREKITIELPSIENPLIKDYPIVLPLPNYSLISQIRKLHIDIIHVHHPLFVGSIARLIGKSKKIPVVFTYHTRYEEYAHHYLPFMPEKLIKKQVTKVVFKFCNHCDAIIATTKTFQKYLKTKLSSPVYYATTAGIPKPMIDKLPKKTLRKQLKLPQNKFILLSVSRHTIEKNLELILQTARLLDKNNFFFVMVGDGLHSQKLKDLAKSLKINNLVKFTGNIPQDKLAPYYSAADAFIYSSSTDTIGINIIEAMSAKLPILAVKDPNAAEVVNHKINGYLLSPIPKKFAQHIKILKINPKLRNQLSSAATDTAKAFSIKSTTSKLITIYNSIIRHK